MSKAVWTLSRFFRASSPMWAVSELGATSSRLSREMSAGPGDWISFG